MMLKIILANLKSLPQRWQPAMVSVIGIAGVMLVLTATLSLAQGFKQALNFAGSPDVAVVVRGGSASELSSNLTGAEAQVIEDVPGVLRDDNGPVLSKELYVLVDLPMQSTHTSANVPFRGVSEQALKVRTHFKIVAGRLFRPGVDEVIAGVGAASQFSGVQVGSVLKFGTRQWTVVGLFSDAGSVTESELWGDRAVLQGAYRRGDTVQSVRLKLIRDDELAGITEQLKSDPRVNVAISSERDFYASQSKALVTLVTTLGSVVAFLMGIGAVFAALNTMYSAVAARTREIATLRAIGFPGSVVLLSVVIESLLLGLVGGVLGGLVSYVAFNGVRATTLNFQTFSQLTFAFDVTAAVVMQGIVYALLLGLIGGILPGLRAARLSVVDGLRST